MTSMTATESARRHQPRSCLKKGPTSSSVPAIPTPPGTPPPRNLDLREQLLGGSVLPLPQKPRPAWRQGPNPDVQGCSPAPSGISTVSWNSSTTASPAASRSSSLGRSSLPSMSIAHTPSSSNGGSGSSTRLPDIALPSSPAGRGSRAGSNTALQRKWSKTGECMMDCSSQQPRASGHAGGSPSVSMTGTASANSTLSNFASRFRSAVSRPAMMASPFRQIRERLTRKTSGINAEPSLAEVPASKPKPTAAAPTEERTLGTSLFRKLEDGESLESCYQITGEIYSVGGRCKVMSAVRKVDDLKVVVKIRTKSARKTHDRSWRKMMEKVAAVGGKAHVLGLVEIIEAEDEYFVVMPECQGGELFNYLASESEIAESECQRIIREILVGIGNLHKRNIMHRDLKPENIMFAHKRSRSLQLIDFDTCMEYTPRPACAPKSTSFVGTPGYIAPEALLGDPTPQSDLWSIGVIMYILMTGEMPWSRVISLKEGRVGSPEARRMYASIQTEGISWSGEPWDTFPEAADLCRRLLAFRTEDRIASAKDALAHPWLSVSA